MNLSQNYVKAALKSGLNEARLPDQDVNFPGEMKHRLRVAKFDSQRSGHGIDPDFRIDLLQRPGAMMNIARINLAARTCGKQAIPLHQPVRKRAAACLKGRAARMIRRVKERT